MRAGDNFAEFCSLYQNYFLVNIPMFEVYNALDWCLFKDAAGAVKFQKHDGGGEGVHNSIEGSPCC